MHPDLLNAHFEVNVTDLPTAPCLAWLYLLYALPMIVFLAVAMPPFQVADEYSHTLRADQVSRSILISPRLGGNVSGGLREFGHLYRDMRLNENVKLDVDTARAAAAITWAQPDQDENFQNTAQYGPLLYLPQAVGLWFGRLTHLNPVWTVLVARLMNASVAVALAFFALRICRHGRALLFTTLLLPITASEFASTSQDALIISLCLFVVAIASRILAEDRAAKIREFALLVSVVVATTMARPSQLLIATLGAAFVDGSRMVRWCKAAIAVFGIILIVAWMITLRKLMPEEPSGASVSGQLNAMIWHPLLLPKVLMITLKQGGFWLFETMVDRLGWLDAPSARWYTWVALVALACAWMAPGNRPPWMRPALLAALTFVAILMATAAALYASWTPIGKMTIDGVQGRYLLPVLPLLGWMAPAYRDRVARILSPLWIAVTAFPLLSMACLPETIMMRYYGSWSNMGNVLHVLFH